MTVDAQSANPNLQQAPEPDDETGTASEPSDDNTTGS